MQNTARTVQPYPPLLRATCVPPQANRTAAKSAGRRPPLFTTFPGGWELKVSSGQLHVSAIEDGDAVVSHSKSVKSSFMLKMGLDTAEMPYPGRHWKESYRADLVFRNRARQ